MLASLPLDETNRKLSARNYRADVYVFVFNDHEWDVLRAEDDRIADGGVLSCKAAPEITGHSRVNVGAIEVYSNRAFPSADMIFAVVLGELEAKATMAKMVIIQKDYERDARGPLLKMHTAMAVLQASLDDD